MKGFLITATCLLTISQVITAQDSQGRGDTKINVPIIIDKGRKYPNKYAPPVPIYLSVFVGDGNISCELPFEDYPIYVEIERTASPYGLWGVCIYDGESLTVEFEPLVGEYKLTLHTSDESSYIGYFTIE